MRAMLPLLAGSWVMIACSQYQARQSFVKLGTVVENRRKTEIPGQTIVADRSFVPNHRPSIVSARMNQ